MVSATYLVSRVCGSSILANPISMLTSYCGTFLRSAPGAAYPTGGEFPRLAKARRQGLVDQVSRVTTTPRPACVAFRIFGTYWLTKIAGGVGVWILHARSRSGQGVGLHFGVSIQCWFRRRNNKDESTEQAARQKSIIHARTNET